MMRHILAAWTVVAAALGPLSREGHAQFGRDTVPVGTVRTVVVPGPSYGSPPLSRAIVGTGWRDVWVTPITVPVLDLGTYAGGLRIDKRGGGFQTVTLHMTERDGWREYRFRSVDKFPTLRLSSTIQGTMAATIIGDQTSSLFPAGPLLAPPFMAAVGGLHVVPKLYVMPDDPRLGEHRKVFAGMLGTLELKGEEAPDDKPGFAGSSKIKDTDKFFEDLAESRAHRIDEREMLAVRLIDMLINDGDRTPDNYDWARFGTKDDYLWRPISRDRDRAFTDANGPLNQYIVRKFYSKFTRFGPEYSLKGLTASSYAFDRRLLQRLTAQDFEQVARGVQRAVTDSVIEAAISALPIEWRTKTDVADHIRTLVVARRALLPDVAMQFYSNLAREPDIRLTNDDERAEIVRHADGRVTVTVPNRAPVAATIADAPNPAGGATRTMNGELDSSSARPAQFYQRTFLPAETKEIRVYLGKGDDVAVIRGAPTSAIRIRVIGDSGADVLADSAGGGATYFYDAEGKNRFVTTGDAHVSEKVWVAPTEVYGFAPGAGWRPDWGGSSGWRPVIKHGQGAGLILGFGPRTRTYGFRRLPHWFDAKAALLVGTGNGRMAVTTEADYRIENSPLALTFGARVSQLEAFRFYGYGNETPDAGSVLSLVEQTTFAAEPAVVWHVGWRDRETDGHTLRTDSVGDVRAARPLIGRLQVGPVFSWTDPEPMTGSPLASGVVGGEAFGLVGARIGVDLESTNHTAVPTRGWILNAKLAAYPATWKLPHAFTTATATGATFVPLGIRGAYLALRAGGALASGDFPAQYAAAIGGSSTLRGYRSRRFAGDASATGSTELRVPVGTLNLLVKSKVGVFGLADVGRVWFDGSSEGGWHPAFGGGLWLSAVGRAVKLSYAKGDEHRLYLTGGVGY